MTGIRPTVIAVIFFVGRTVNAWNFLLTSAFNHESVSGYKRFLGD